MERLRHDSGSTVFRVSGGEGDGFAAVLGLDLLTTPLQFDNSATYEGTPITASNFTPIERGQYIAMGREGMTITLEVSGSFSIDWECVSTSGTCTHTYGENASGSFSGALKIQFPPYKCMPLGCAKGILGLYYLYPDDPDSESLFTNVVSGIGTITTYSTYSGTCSGSSHDSTSTTDVDLHLRFPVGTLPVLYFVRALDPDTLLPVVKMFFAAKVFVDIRAGSTLVAQGVAYFFTGLPYSTDPDYYAGGGDCPEGNTATEAASGGSLLGGTVKIIRCQEDVDGIASCGVGVSVGHREIYFSGGVSS